MEMADLNMLTLLRPCWGTFPATNVPAPNCHTDAKLFPVHIWIDERRQFRVEGRHADSLSLQDAAQTRAQ